MAKKPAISDKQVRAREKAILGKPPRFPQLTSDAQVKEAMSLSLRLRKAALPDAPPLKTVEQMPDIMTTLVCHPVLWERVALVSVELLGHGTLTRRDTELAVLRTAWVCQAPYEWGEHIAQAKRAGVTDKEIDRITEGPAARGWSAKDRAVLRAIDELDADAMVSDKTWNALSKHFDHKQLFELLVLIGQFTMVAYFQNTLRLRLEPSNQGLTAR